MRKSNLIIFFFIVLLNNFVFLNSYSQIYNQIIVKVGDFAITSIDVQNEILTSLILNKTEISQENINNYKSFAIKNLISKSIKKSEIDKYQIKKYNTKDLENFVTGIAKNFNTNKNGLKEIFKKNNIDYKVFLQNYETELLWNTLIFEIYRNQTNINIVDVDNEIQKISENKNDEELKEIRNSILNKKKEEKLSLFSRSHFSNLENSIVIEFK
ncbi:hypothetical protein OAL70_04615 [Pelagibacteraceae bacterium]|nr:hypothetical protein [Pelagibacteraceae bacterium]